MKLEISPEVDIVYLRVSDNQIVESDKNEFDAIVDYDPAGKPVGYEILGATKRFGNLSQLTAERVLEAVCPTMTAAA